MAERPVLFAVWIVGFIVLFLRLVAKNVEISGHMTWLPIHTAQSLVLKMPAWFIGVAAASTVAAIWQKFVEFRGPSGLPGLMLGVGLALAILAANAQWNGIVRRPSSPPE
ncbi:MAG TPA: hypothetical protein VJ691_13280 [Vicinamibacterales bacterium]|nr:hypothetical protein [Vicinamibacterales bacterium]